MTQPNWQPLASGVLVLAKPAALWTRAVDYIAGPRKLKIQADPNANWTLLPSCSPGPEGDPGREQNPTSLLPTALIGALIAKVGGSAADITGPTLVALPGSPQPPPVLTQPPVGLPVPFSIGSFCIVELSASQKGSLFLTMNDVPMAFTNHVGQLTVDIFEAL